MDGTITLLDGVNIRNFNGFIQNISGFLDDPEPKDTLLHSWLEDHGIDVDLSTLRFNERKCELNYIIKGSSLADLVSKIIAFKTAINKNNYRYLKLYGIPGIFLIYVSGKIGVVRLNRGILNVQHAKLNIPLIEPYPIKYQYYTEQDPLAQVELVISGTKPITIDWGDNTYSSLSGSGVKTHNYTATGVYCIVIYGGVDGITNITPTNAIEIYGITGLDVDASTTTSSADSTIITADNA